jgi:transposase
MAGMSEPRMTHEEVDDIPVLMHVMRERLGFDQAFDEIVGGHGNWLGLSKGQVLVTWLTHVLSECSHFMSPVREWANARPQTLSHLLGQALRETDLTDDRLAEIVRWLSDDRIWHPLEAQVNERMLRVYRLPARRLRLDTTTASIDTARELSVLFQRGFSKDHRPDLPQLKVMLAALDPLGVLLAADVVSGNRADDGLYVPMVDRLLTQLTEPGLLFIGDSKMSALTTRAHIQGGGHRYLTPLAKVGQVPAHLAEWVARATQGKVPLRRLPADDGSEWGEGYEFTRPQSGPDAQGSERRWTERVLVVRSRRFAEAAQRGWAQRLQRAEAALNALTPARGRGHRQFTDESALREAVQTILDKHEVTEFLTVNIQPQVEPRQVRAYGSRAARTEERVRYTVVVKHNQRRIESHVQTLGWRAYVTNASRQALPLREAVQVYCDEWLVERNCQRLKGRTLSLAPMWVTREDHAIGLTRLLTLAARVLALIEYDVRRNLSEQQRLLAGLFPGQASRTTDRPTTERLLKAFDQIALVVIRHGKQLQRYLTPLSTLHKDILRLMSCPANLYQRLIMDSG